MGNAHSVLAVAVAVRFGQCCWVAHKAVKDHEAEAKRNAEQLGWTGADSGELGSRLRIRRPRCSAGEVITQDEFETRFGLAMRDVQDGDTVSALGSPYMLLSRESSAFAGSGRAALLQLAHPYVASGVTAHSTIGNDGAGVQERFYKTFYYLFRIIFGEKKVAVRAARAVRQLHNKVHGTLPDTVGQYRAGERYDANNAEAMVWVEATLLDTAVMMHRAMKSSLSEPFLDEVVRETFVHRALFGIPPEVGFGATWKEFSAYCHAMAHSRSIIIVSPEAKRLQRFLFAPPHPIFGPFMWLLKVSAGAMMPRRIAEEFGIRPGPLGYMCAVLAMGLFRMVYTMLPKGFRFLSKYIEAERRAGIHRPLWQSKLASWLATFFLNLAMPPRSGAKKQHMNHELEGPHAIGASGAGRGRVADSVASRHAVHA